MMKINLQEIFIKDNIFDKKEFKKFKKEFLEFEEKYNKKKRISISSAKAKGRNLMLYVRDIFRLIHKDNLQNGDVECTVGFEHGRDIKLSPLAENFIPFDIECKYQETLNIYGTISQCLANTKENRIPLIIFRKNGLKPWAALQLNDFLKLIYNIDENTLKTLKDEDEKETTTGQ